jgi:hypothetical protein
MQEEITDEVLTNFTDRVKGGIDIVVVKLVDIDNLAPEIIIRALSVWWERFHC